MSRSQSVRIEDVRSVLDLVAEVYALREDPHAMRMHLLSGMQALLRADKATFPEVVDFREGGTCQVASSLAHGFTDDELKYLIAYATYDSSEDPAFPPILASGVGRFALRREDAMSVKKWHDTKHAAVYCKGANTGPCLYAGYVLDSERLIGIGLHRERNARPFSARDRNIADLLVGHFGPKILLPPPANSLSRTVQELSPQLRRTLLLLLGGHSEKQVAREMDLSRHTVHDYVKQLYSRMKVNARSELLALFLPTRGASAEGAKAWQELLRDESFRQFRIRPAQPR